MRWVSLVVDVSLVTIAACVPGSPKPVGDASPATTSTEPTPEASSAPTDDAPPAPRGARLCLPVAACNMFVSCALVEEQPDPEHPRALRYLVRSYQHHPHKIGSHFRRGTVCWPKQADNTPEGCADALLYDDVPCTPVPPEQMALRFTCTMGEGPCADAR